VRRITDPAEQQRVGGLYRAKFPFVDDLEEVVTAGTFYELKPFWVRWLDNSQGLGHKAEFVLDWPEDEG
jgi:uncharacterized protein YhbP (UPF0306 family)